MSIAKKNGLERDYAVVVTLAYSGIRIGELCALKWRDIDFENRTMRITKTYKNEKNNIKNYAIDTPKTKSLSRQIVVGHEIIEALKKHKAHQNKIKIYYREITYNKVRKNEKEKPSVPPKW